MLLSRDRQFYRQLGRLTAFIALQNVIVCMVGLVDNIMIGAYSQQALAGIALVNQVQFLLQMLIGGISDGMSVLTSQYWGTKRLKPIRSVMTIALWCALVCACLFTGFAYTMPESILRLFTSDAPTIAEGVKYMRIICWSYPFFGLGYVLVGAHRSVEKVHIGMIASFTGLVVNVIGNYALIFGHFGMPQLGTQGAAYATMTARMVECMVIVVYTYVIDRQLALKWKAFFIIDKTLLKDFAKVAIPVVFSGGSWGVIQGVQTAILGHLGAEAIAANAIAATLFQVVSVAVYGMGAASCVIIAKAVGRDDRENLRGYVNSLQCMYVAIGLITGAVLFLCKDLILSFYTLTPDAMALANQFMIVLSVTVIGTGYQFCCLAGIVRGGGNTKFVFINDCIFLYGMVLPLSFLAAFVWNLDPVWVFICLKSDQITKCFVALWQVNSYRWVKKVTRDDISA